MDELRVSSVGYFGIPGRTPSISRDPVIHAVFQGKPICGIRLHRDAEYQFCASGFNHKMVTCVGCLKVIERHRVPEQEIKEALQEMDCCRDCLATINQQISRIMRRLDTAIKKAEASDRKLNAFLKRKT